MRCLRCNAPLDEVSLEEVLQLLPPRVRELQRELRRCPRCRRVYWPGSHVRRMEGLVARLTARATSGPA